MKAVLLGLVLSSITASASTRLICGDRAHDSYFFDATAVRNLKPGQTAKLALNFKYFRSSEIKVDEIECSKPVVNPISAEHAPELSCSSAKFDIIVEKASRYPAVLTVDIYSKENSSVIQGGIPCELTTTPDLILASQTKISASDQDLAPLLKDCSDCIVLSQALSLAVKQDPCLQAAIAVSVKSEIQKATNGGYDIPDTFAVHKANASSDRTSFALSMESRESVSCAGQLKENATEHTCHAELSSGCN